MLASLPSVFLRPYWYWLLHASLSRVSLRSMRRYGDVLTDKDGLPLVYDSDSIGRYWDKRPGEVRVPLHVGGCYIRELS